MRNNILLSVLADTDRSAGHPWLRLRGHLLIWFLAFIAASCAQDGSLKQLSAHWLLRSKFSPVNEGGRPPDDLLRKTSFFSVLVDDRVERASFVGDDCVFYFRQRSVGVTGEEAYAVCGSKVPALVLVHRLDEWELTPNGLWNATGLKVQQRHVIETGQRLSLASMKGAAMAQARFVPGWRTFRPPTPSILPESGELLISANRRAGSTGKTPLMQAVAADDVALIRELIRVGADVDAKDQYGDTALIFAASQGDPDVVTALMQAGTQINAQNYYDGRTALMAAIDKRNEKAAHLLIDAGADTDIRDKSGQTAEMHAASGMQVELAQYLRDVQREKQQRKR